MTTPDVRKSEIKGFLRLQEQQGGIKPSKLQAGQKVLVETRHYVYQLSVVDTPTGRRFFVDTGAPFCQGEHVCTEIKSHSPKLKYEMVDWIGKDMRMIMSFASGKQIMTSEVFGATVSGESTNGSTYRYEIWEKSDISG